MNKVKVSIEIPKTKSKINLEIEDSQLKELSKIIEEESKLGSLHRGIKFLLDED